MSTAGRYTAVVVLQVANVVQTVAVEPPFRFCPDMVGAVRLMKKLQLNGDVIGSTAR